MHVILLVSHWSESVGGHQTSTVAVGMLQGAQRALEYMCTQTGTEAGIMFTDVKLFQAQCVHHK